MKIGVISDTHDNLAATQKALEIFKNQNVDLIVHCGDWCAPFVISFFIENSANIPIKGVFGNNEGDKLKIMRKNQASSRPILFADEKVLELEEDGRKIACYHGEDKIILDALITCKKYDAIFTGHTHEVRNEIINDALILNPGAVCYASGGGITTEATIAIYNPQENSAQIIKI